MNLDDALEANDLVTEVFRKYHQIIIKNRPKYVNACLISTQNSSANGSAANGNGQNGSNNTSKNTMDELHEIFASTSSNTNATHSNGKPIMTTLTPLEPTTLATPKVKSNGSVEFLFLFQTYLYIRQTNRLVLSFLYRRNFIRQIMAGNKGFEQCN